MSEISIGEWIGYSIVTLTLALWTVAPREFSVMWAAALVVSTVMAGLVVIEGVLNLQSRSLLASKPSGPDG